MNKILVDTDVLINFTKGHDRALKDWMELQDKNKVNLVISPVNVAEFLNDKNLNVTSKLEKAKDFLSYFEVIDISRPTGMQAGEILRVRQSEYLGDAMVAAVCVVGNIPLLTNNKKHFEGIKDLKFAGLPHKEKAVN